VSDDLSGFSLMELFRLEAEGQLAALTAGLLALETSSESTVIEPMMRAAHSLKGAARIVGMSEAERIAHVLEDVFVAAQHGRSQLAADEIDRLLRAVDLLSEIAKQDDGSLPAWSTSNTPRIEETIRSISAIGSGGSSEATTGVGSSEVRSAIVNPSLSLPDALLEEGGLKEQALVSSTTAVKGRRRGRSIREPSVPSAASLSIDSVPGPSPTGRVEPGEPPLTPSGSTVDTTALIAAPVESVDRVVRVSAENLNRLMGLAGESLVEAKRLRPLVDAMVGLRGDLATLGQGLDRLDEGVDRAAGESSGVPRAVVGEARRAAQRCLEDLGQWLERVELHARRTEDLVERLHFEVISSRLRPLSDGIKGFPRLVRDVARQLGKQVRLEVVGESTGVDRDILEKLEAPLSHLIRNALDHGIESSDERGVSAKSPVATIRLEARHVAGMLQIILSDDGRGIDIERIRAKVVERGYASDTIAAQLSEAEVLEFLFLPGFSTKEKVTDLSGRGVGLDVVQSMVQGVGGTVRVSTRLNRGTTFALQLPITMSVIRALLVRIGGEPYAFPLARLDRILKLPREEIEVIEGRRFFKMDDRTVGLVSAAQVLDRSASPASEGHLHVVVVSDRSHCFGVAVESFLGELDLDVRPLDSRLGKVPNINSVSILEDGWPVLIIDVEDLVRSIDNLLGGKRALTLAESAAAASRSRAARRVLVVDDSITVRELERQLLESRGYVVEVAVDGMDGWNAVRTGRYDLVVSDVDMPRMDGIQLVRQIKQDARLSSTPVVIVSYKDRAEDRLRGLEAGADSYLTKGSFHDETFLTTVEDLIGAARP